MNSKRPCSDPKLLLRHKKIDFLDELNQIEIRKLFEIDYFLHLFKSVKYNIQN